MGDNRIGMNGNAKARRRVTPNFVSDHAQSMIVSLWYAGKDTKDIAQALGFFEHEVANRLMALRSRHKQMRGCDR